MESRREVISSSGAPEAIGPYSQGVRSGHLVFVSGQIGMDPATGEIVSPDVVEQTRQALNNMREILKASGVGLGDVVKTTIYLVDLSDFTAMNQVYAEYFPAEPPARATVQVSGLPKGAMVEIEAVAILSEERP